LISIVSFFAAGLAFVVFGATFEISLTGLLMTLAISLYVVRRIEPVTTGDLWVGLGIRD